MLKIIEVDTIKNLRPLGLLIGGKLRSWEEDRLYRIQRNLDRYRTNDIIYKIKANEEENYYLIEVQENDYCLQEVVFSLRCTYNFNVMVR